MILLESQHLESQLYQPNHNEPRFFSTFLKALLTL